MVKEFLKTGKKELKDRALWGVLMALTAIMIFSIGTPVVEVFILSCVWRISYEWVHLRKGIEKKDSFLQDSSVIYLGVFQSLVFIVARLHGPWWALSVFGALLLIVYLFSPGKYKGWNLIGCCYFSVILISSAWVLKYFKNGSLFLLWIIFIVTLVDASAYFIGSSIKGAKFYPKISPNKTWSGVFGGIAGGVAGALIGAVFCYKCSFCFLAVFGFFIAVSAILGDLIESYFKRCQGVKDVRSIIPGHGGFLDRLDSLLVALPIAVIIIRVFPGKLLFVLLP